MKRVEVDSTGRVEQMVYNQLGKNELYDVGYRVRRKMKQIEEKK